MLTTLSAIATLAMAPAPKEVRPIRVDGMLAHPSNLLVRVDGAVTKQRIRKELGLRLVRDLPQIGYIVVEAPKTKLRNTKQKLEGTIGVLSVDYDRAAEAAYTPNDPLFSSQWGLPMMNLPAAWDVTLGSTATTIAILDTGVNVAHPDLASIVWVNAGEVPSNGLDDDGNGYIDDINGYDFSNNDNNPADDHGHGTACSGIAAATMDNTTGMSGVAKFARVMAMKVANSAGYFYDSATVPGYLYAADNGAKIFSCSFYSDRVSRAEKAAIDYAVAQGVLVFVAAGNANSSIPFYPARYDNVVAVAAMRQNASWVLKATFSNHGTWVDVSAPGQSIQYTNSGGGYSSGSGTSFACPLTAGVAALLWSANPAATAAQVRAAIEDTATDYTEAPFGPVGNYGFVNAQAAINAFLFTPAAPKSARVRFMTPLGARPEWDRERQLARIEGRGFEAPANVVLRKAGQLMRVMRRGRQFVEFYNTPGSAPIDVYVNGTLVDSVPQPLGDGYAYSIADANTETRSGATYSGGFDEALMADGTTLDCTRRTDLTIWLEGSFHKVKIHGTGDMKLRYTRHYTGMAGTETETVYLYDWSSKSYDYGVWIPVHTQTVPTSSATTEITVPEAWRHVDFEGSLYFKVVTSANVPAAGTLKLDQMLLSR